MAQLINLPAYKVPNALNWTGLDSGIESVKQNALMQQQMGMQKERLGMDRERMGMEKQKFDTQQQMATVQRVGGLAQMGLSEKDPARRQAILDRIISMHPDKTKLGPEYLSADTAFPMLIQEAEGFRGQDEQAKLGLTRAQTTLAEAQAEKARREAADGSSGFGREIKPYQTPDGKIWGVQAAANGGRMMHDLSNPNSQPIYIPAGRPMPPGMAPQGGPPAIGQQPAMPQVGAPMPTPGMPPASAGPGGPLTPFRGVSKVGDQMIDNATGLPKTGVGDALRGGAYATEEGKAVIADIKSRDEAIQASRSKMPRLEIMSQLIDSPEIYQGTGGNAVLELKKAATALGMDVAGVSGAEAIRAIGNQFALQLRNPAGGEGMPGALSDSDRNFLVQSTPNLGNTRDGNRLLVKSMIDLERHKMKENAEAQRFLRQHRSSAGMAEHMDAWAQRNPALSKATRDAISRATGIQYGARSGPADGQRVDGKQGGRLGDQTQTTPRGASSFASPGLGGGVPRIQGDDDYNALPPGSQYYAPDGSLRRKN